MSTSSLPPQLESQKIELEKRMAQTGVTEQMLTMFKDKLRESGWDGDVKNFAKERARRQDPLSYETLAKDVFPYASGKVPENVKLEMIQEIKKYILSQVDEEGGVKRS